MGFFFIVMACRCAFHVNAANQVKKKNLRKWHLLFWYFDLIILLYQHNNKCVREGLFVNSDDLKICIQIQNSCISGVGQLAPIAPSIPFL